MKLQLNLQDTKRNNHLILSIRAALFVALIFFGIPSYSAVKTWPEIKERVEKLLLKNKSQKAINLINKFLKKKNPPKITSQAEQFLNQVVNMFITNEGHKLFYLAKSLKYSEPERAIEELLNAQEKEPINEKIFIELGRIYLAQNQCGKAESVMERALNQNKTSLSPWTLYLQALSCNKKWEKYKEIKDKAQELLKESTFDESIINFIELAENEKTSELTEEQLEKIRKIDPDFPLIYYWQGLWKKQNNRDFTEDAQKYLSICKKPNLKVLRTYDNYPNACSYRGEVQTWL